MPRVFGRGCRSQPAALVSDRDDAALFPAIRILERYGSAKSVRAVGERATLLSKLDRFLTIRNRISDGLAGTVIEELIKKQRNASHRSRIMCRIKRL
jgi:hypothetical protein